MISIVTEVILDTLRNNPKGGERFFTELDENLRTVEALQEFLYFVPRNFNNIICSGKFGKFLKDNSSFYNLINVEGGLRKGGTVDLSKYHDRIEGKVFVFLDDSFYSGNTCRAIRKAIEREGGLLHRTYVMYDGSTQEYQETHRWDVSRSLFRYHKEAKPL